MSRKRVASLIAILLPLAACQRTEPLVSTPTPAPAAATNPAPAAKPSQPDYHPSLADLMTSAVQVRHIKLAQAAKAKNWRYAAYEADELGNAFNRIARTIPDYRNNDLSKMFDANIKPALEALKAAVKSSDSRAFDAAYGDVTRQCNACHEALDHPFVKIRVPGNEALFPDQDFRATD